MALQNTIIVVNEEPYCIWEVDVKKRNVEFISGIDVEYFQYLLKVHWDAEDEKRASIALRTALHHATETLFSLLGAYIQAPDCAYAWVAKCSNKELRSLIRKIDDGYFDVFSKFNIDEVSWKSVAALVFRTYLPNTDKNEKTRRLFAEFWGRLAQEYLDDKNIDEYNSLKHGFRVRSGGFSIAIGMEHEYGVAPPDVEMTSLGGSEYGTTYIRLEPIGETKGNRSLRSRKISLNWSVEKVALQLQLVCASINNTVSALKIANDIEAGACKFVRPTEDDDFAKPWSFSPTVLNCSMDFVIDEAQVKQVTKDELSKVLNSQKTNKRT